MNKRIMQLLIVPMMLISFCSPAQNPDSLRQVIRLMKFEVPQLSPLPYSVAGVKEPILSLNGTWQFNPENKDRSRARNIEVPGEWEMQGFKVEKGTTATYRKTFHLPVDWETKRIKIRFDGISSYANIKVNGKNTGSHEGSFVAFEFDITDAVKPGGNELEIEVQCETISDQLACTSQYAAHPVGGILRKVTLFALPRVHLSDASWNINFDSMYQDATLGISNKMACEGNPPSRLQLKFDLLDKSGKTLKLAENSFDIPVSDLNKVVNSTLLIPSPKKWDPEHPYLYQLVTTLVADGKVVQTNRQKIGFRQVELRGNQLFVNNCPVKLRGINRHEVHPLSGRSLTPELCRRDVELFRAGNCNYIRTSHYPPSEEFLSACDELGMFVESEASLCWIEHNASPIWKKWKYDDPQFLPFMVRANHENVLSGRQHPSIIIWSLGNESRWSPLWERVNAEVKQLDSSRPTAFHDQCWGNYNNAASKADIANYHYPALNGPRECEKEKTRPTLFGEYMHVQCYARRELETDPSVRSDVWASTLKQMVDSVYQYPACLGGAIWSGVDDIFHLSADKICGYGPWGPIDGWRREKPEFIGMKKSYAPVIITNLEMAKAVNGIIKLDIENRYNFTNLSELKINAKSGSEVFTVKADIAPLGKGSVLIDLKKGVPAEKLQIIFTDPRGFVCQEEIIKTGEAPSPSLPVVKIKPVLSEDNNNFYVQTGKSHFSFSKKSGTFACYQTPDIPLITSGGEIMLVPFNNDDGGGANVAGNNYNQDIKPLEYPVEKLNDGLVSATQHPDGSIEVNLNGMVANRLGVCRSYRFNTDGSVTVDYDYTTLIDFTGKNRLRQYGLLFTLPVSFDHLSWERKGLWTIYPENDINRLKGSARALPRNQKYVELPRVVPAGDWKDDANKLGTNDFRSTRDHIVQASLKNDQNTELMILSDGSQSVRSWVDGNFTHVLVTGLNGPGSCGFFTGPRPEFKKGDHLKGTFKLRLP